MLSSQNRNVNSDTIRAISSVADLNSCFNSKIHDNQLLNLVMSLRNLSIFDVVCFLLLDKYSAVFHTNSYAVLLIAVNFVLS